MGNFWANFWAIWASLVIGAIMGAISGNFAYEAVEYLKRRRKDTKEDKSKNG